MENKEKLNSDTSPKKEETPVKKESAFKKAENLESKLNHKLQKYKNPKNFKRNLLATLFIALGLSMGVGTITSYGFSQKFDEKMLQLTERLSNDKYDVSYTSANSWLFFYKKAAIKISPKDVGIAVPTSQITIEAISSPTELYADIYVEDKAPLNEIIGKYGITQLKLSAGFRSAELKFKVDSQIPVAYALDKEGTTKVTSHKYTGLVKFDYSESDFDKLILNLTAPEASIETSIANNVKVNLKNVTYSAPISSFLKAADDYTAPSFSHLQIGSVDIANDIQMYSFSNAEYYRRVQSDGREANGLKFGIGKNIILGNVVLEGTNTPIVSAQPDLNTFNADYELRLTGQAFTEPKNTVIQGLIKSDYLTEKENKTLSAKLKVQDGNFTINGKSLAPLVGEVMGFGNSFLSKGKQSDGSKVPAPQLTLPDED